MIRQCTVLGIAFLILILAGCAPYKQLKPKPQLSDAEQGFIELKNDKKDFELKKNKCYFITFPAPLENNFYLVLDIPNKSSFGSCFTASLVDKKKVGPKIADESPDPQKTSVYPIDTKSPSFYWLIDRVPQDMVLKMQYRYVPQWRFKYETKSSRMKETLAKNRVDRTPFKSIGPSFHLEGFDFALAIDSVSRHFTALDNVHKELIEIDSIFPKSKLNSDDPAYKDYLQLKGEVEDELAFQNAYHLTLDFFYKQAQCKDKAGDLLGKVPDFIAFFSKKQILPDNVLKECQAVLAKSITTIKPFYEKKLDEKNDAKPLEPDFFKLTSLAKIPELYQTAGVPMPQDIGNLFNFINAFDAKSKAMSVVPDSIAAVYKYIKAQPSMPADNFFEGIVNRTTAIQSLVPRSIDAQYGTYLSYICSEKLNQNISKTSEDINKRLGEFRQAQILVPQLNILKAQRDYSGMLGVLRQYLGMGFLIDKYRDLDKMSLDEQAKNINASLDNSAWAGAEAGLTKLHADKNFIDQSGMLPQKELAVRNLEDSLYTRIERVTRTRVNKFCEEKVNQLENVDSLYTDSVFLPVYDVKFSSGSKRELIDKKNALIDDLAKMKDNEFPAKAIKLMYDLFIKEPGDNGVLKARAIVTHGTHYKGDDKEIKLRIAECDPNLAKWITKPKDYRRIFALPVTTKLHGKNKYIVRLNINIPTEATFPVYDVNIKLPKEIAQNAAATQWYDAISLNKILLKNEGRFVITAPSATNDYECQITPVQMNKDQGNILEVVFSYDAFKPFIVSVMVQKPIIKKN
jgi:hypothetical protein